MFTNRRPYYGLKMSTTDFFREPVRYLKESNTQESMMEKPYLEDEYPKMHLKLPGFKFKPKEIPSIFGPIADGEPFPGLAMIDFGDANCGWYITNIDGCVDGSVLITMWADYLWHAEFAFVAGITSDSIGVSLTQLAGTEASGRDRQDYRLTFPENADGSVTVCGFASTHTLVSQTFETVVAGMPVGIHLVGGALLPIERGQAKPATLLKSVYGDKGDDCGCITLSSNCSPECECKTIGYTTQQMSADEEQTLTVIDHSEGCTYFWAISSGGGHLSSPTGTSVCYYAPPSNANCEQNPTITLSLDETVCDTLQLAVNSSAINHNAYYEIYTTEVQACVWEIKRRTRKCDGTVTSGSNITCDACSCDACAQCCCGFIRETPGDCQPNWSCDPAGFYCLESNLQARCQAGDLCGIGTCDDGFYDTRSDGEIEAGCCPAVFL